MKSNILNLKKLALSVIIIFIAIVMFGCSNGSSKAIKSLNEELDNLSSVVSSTNSSEISDVSPIVFYSTNKTEIDNYKALSSANMSREEEIRQRVLSLNSYIKSCCYDNLKLSKAQTNAVGNLTRDIKKYNQLLKNTKPEIKTTVDKIKKNLKNSNTNNVIAETAYLSLNNCMNERFVCLCNLYNNLEQAYILLCKDCENCNNFNQNIDNSFIEDKNLEENRNENQIKQDSRIENNDEKKIENEQNKNDKLFKKNIDSYLRNDIEKINKNQSTNQNSQYANQNNQFVNQNPNNVGYYNYPPYYGYNRPYNAPINNSYMPYNNPYGFGLNNGMFGNGYLNNGMFGYPYGGMANGYFLNPNRNTDTFYAFNKNIDTYRLNPNAVNNGILNNYAINDLPVAANAEINEEIECLNKNEINLNENKTKETSLNENNIEEIKENKKLKPNTVISLNYK